MIMIQKSWNSNILIIELFAVTKMVQFYPIVHGVKKIK
uniref:Uncharacterized protein n=1 Tax=Moumouvirus sp. 'Monve' TaxID=1128131 RepID=H2EFQ4_9VIRU|nr:hypothetical protein mv_R1117 [Moumouvirus Monve]